jgi:hypothetical protein
MLQNVAVLVQMWHSKINECKVHWHSMREVF